MTRLSCNRVRRYCPLPFALLPTLFHNSHIAARLLHSRSMFALLLIPLTPSLFFCRRWGLDNAGEFRQSDFSANSVVRSLSIGSGETCQGTPGACTAFKWIECLRGNSKPGCSRMLDNDGPTNQGFGNVGTSNVGNFNNGSANVGDFNLGSANVGSFNLGSAVVGNYQSCSACTSPDLQHL